MTPLSLAAFELEGIEAIRQHFQQIETGWQSRGNGIKNRAIEQENSTEQECPYCKSKRVIKNGTNRHGKQNHECKDCHRQFVTK
ncbi:IS1/IS1595 family N-terminal zinc-binding domain-containing protein [Pseudanabaena galeata]